MVLEGHTSSPLDALFGIPQGTVLGPLLSWSIFMTYLMYQGVYQTPDCSQMIGWYTIRQTQKQRDAAKLQEDLTALEGKKVADMFKP